MLGVRGAESQVHWGQTFTKAEDCATLRPICEPANQQHLRRLAAAVARRH
ncbi:MAG: hypothetical protein H0W72_02575 [Planctomycetes bacterium]|nr:hypothetical protein [Planctomycetota bacterium]